MAAVCVALSCHASLAAPGDLDPGFADLGRFVPVTGYWGPVRSISLQSDTEYLFAGGRTVRGPDPDLATRGYVGRLSSAGIPDAAYSQGFSIEVLDTAVQRDGKVVAVGRTGLGAIVLRLDRDGSADAGFGDSGSVRDVGPDRVHTSVALEPDGRILVAGQRGSDLVVQRLLPNGDPDGTFADAGVFRAAMPGGGLRTIIVPAGGGYRLVVHDSPGAFPRCRVLALTVSGTVDESYGQQGFAAVGPPADAPVVCRSLAALGDDRLLIVGNRSVRAFAVRLGTGGEPDPGFGTEAVAAAMSYPGAAAVAADGTSIVAGRSLSGEAGVRVLRLRADGTIDDRYGSAGTAWIDLPGAAASDLTLLPGGGVLVAGGLHSIDGAVGTGGPFVVRLLGDVGSDGAGVAGFTWPRIEVTESGAQAALTVRRTGGRTGALSVSYRTRAVAGDDPFGPVAATEGEDYVAVTGTLYWASGDTEDRQVLVPIATDRGVPEELESFEVELTGTDGSSAIGTGIARVDIAADGAPAGMFAIDTSSAHQGEGSTVRVVVQRAYYSSGAVSVTVTPVSGSAVAGGDFTAAPQTVSWTDGDAGDRYVDIPIVDDRTHETTETFTVELTGATGGAVIGPRSTMTIAIADDDPANPGVPDPPPVGNSGSSGGGGHFGWLSLILLAVATAQRRD
jgi:uncharacterized delta-60 repeat protein